MEKKCTKIAHHVPFELSWLINFFGEEIARASRWEDTMVQAYMIDSRTGEKKRNDERKAVYQSLDFLCLMFFGLHLKSISKVNRAKLADEKIENILPYNALDTKFTFDLFFKQNRIVSYLGLNKSKGSDPSIYDQQIRRLPTIALMQRLGVPVSQKAIKSIHNDLQNGTDEDQGIKEVIDDIQSMKVVKQFIKDHKEFNPLSNKDLILLLKDYLKREEIKVLKKHLKSGDDPYTYSVDENVLTQIDHPIAEAILYLRSRSKLKSTYCDGLCLDDSLLDEEAIKKRVIFPDGYLHPSINSTFAESGRLSFDNPSLQNWPKRKSKWVRRGIAAPKGFILLSGDYGQQEGCTAAMCSKDKYLVDALWHDYDIHMDWSNRIVDIYPEIIGGRKFASDKDVIKDLRQRMKNKFVFPAFYGAMAESIAGYLNIPVEIANELMEHFWSELPGFKKWQDRTMDTYYKEGYTSTLTGRLRWYPLSRNQVINHPIQGTASDITVDAMNRLSEKAMETGNMFIHPRVNVHDDLIAMCENTDKVIEESIDTFLNTMLRVPYSWVNVPMSVEISIGKNWYDMETIGKFYSHKDL
jgi:DNA polymerase I-like protein with 3'-5' exonuclease and polymerase domains